MQLMLGTAVLSFGLYNVHSQSDITEGGVLGLQLLIQNWFGVSPSVIGPVLDLICYLIGWRILGGAFLKNAWYPRSATVSFTRSMREWGICFRTWAAVRCLQPLWEAFSWESA